MIEVLRTGSHICIVDIGREGYQNYGVPVSGAMDIISLARANSLLGNQLDCAVLEMYLPGHQLQFHCDTHIALTGAEANIQLCNKNIYIDSTVKVNKGDILSIGPMTRGCRLYLAVSQGINSALTLGSRSPLTGYLSSTIQKGDKISITNTNNPIKKSAITSALSIDKNQKLTCRIGPEWTKISAKNRTSIITNNYTISHKSDRMGYRLEGSPIKTKSIQLLSSPVMTGTVQLLPSGLPLILMRDCQTTGGYPRILQIDTYDINQLAQRKPSDEVRFQLTNS